MMDNYCKCITFNYPETIPVASSIYAPTWRRHGEALEEIVLSHPNIFPNYKKGDYLPNLQPTTSFWAYELGKHIDHWGCEWDNLVDGHDSICIRPALPDLDDVDSLPLPEKNIGLEHGLMFLRLTYIRGYENAMIDFIEERPEFYRLIEKVIEYNLIQVERMLNPNNTYPVVHFADDLGTQTALPTGPERWRKILKPCFMRLMKPCKDKDKLIYMHSDGCIHEIIPDLKDCGVDMINPQYRANGLDNLKRVTRGEGRNKIAVHLDLDRQLFPFATPSQLEDHIMECVEALYLPSGGMALFAEISEDIPLENIAAIYNALEKARVYK